MNYLKSISFLCIASYGFFLCCSPIHQISALKKNDSSLSCGVGGPITKVGNLYIPLPLLSIGYNRGVVDSLVDVQIRFHALSALFGVFHCDGGLNYRPLKNRGYIPGIIVSPQFSVMSNGNKHGSKVYPDLALTGVWQIVPSLSIYTGVETFVEFSTWRMDGNKQEHTLLYAPFLGIYKQMNSWFVEVEGRIYTPNISNTQRPVKNIGIAQHGMFGLFFGFGYSFLKESP